MKKKKIAKSNLQLILKKTSKDLAINQNPSNYLLKI